MVALRSGLSAVAEKACYNPKSSMKMLRVSVAVVLVLLAGGFAEGDGGGAIGGGPVPLVVEITAQEVLYSHDRQTAFAKGDVEVAVRRRDMPDWWVRVTAAEATADLATGVAEAAQGVRVETEYATFAGRSCHFDLAQGIFWVKQASAAVDLPLAAPGLAPRAYFSGQEAGGRRDVYYVIRGRVTTCDRAQPHWAIEARELTYSTRTGRLKVRGGRVRLYGKSIPLLSPLSLSVGPSKEKRRHLAGTPGYSSRDGLYVPGSFRFSGEGKSTVLSTSYKVGVRRGWTGYIGADHYSDVNEWSLGYTRRETRYFRLRDFYCLDRAPEASFTHHFVPLNSSEAFRRTLDLTLSAGYYREKPDRHDLPEQSAGRFSVSLESAYNLAARERLEGEWAGWAGRWNQYDTGQHFGVLELYAGQGLRLSERLAAGLTFRHHVTTGERLLLMDVPDIRTELAPEVWWDFDPRWRLILEGRYDLGDDRLADYVIELQRQVHCLTWFTRYRYANDSWMVGVTLSGLTPRVKGHGEPSASLPGDVTSDQAELAEP